MSRTRVLVLVLLCGWWPGGAALNAAEPHKAGGAKQHREPRLAGTLAPATSTAFAQLSNGTGDGSVSVVVDAYGSFGSATPAGDATYDPIGPLAPAGTVYESGVYFGPLGDFLTTDDFGAALPRIDFDVVDQQLAVSTFDVAGYHFQLRQFLNPVGPSGSTLTQEYRITNDTGAPATFSLVRHVDGDLAFDGSIADYGGVTADGRIVFELDAGDDPRQPLTLVGIATSGGTRIGYAVEPFRFTGAIQAAGGIPRELLNQVAGDTSGDGLTDSGADLTLSVEDSVTIAPGETATYTTETFFGSIIEPSVVAFAGAAPVVEGNSGTRAAAVQALLNRAASSEVAVDYQTQDATATAGSDYASASGTLVFAPGEVEKTVSITVLGDLEEEGDESFRFVLSSASVPAAGALVRILDDDPPIRSFSANPALIVSGGSSTLAWTAVEGSAATLDGAPVAAVGSRTVSPAETTSYTLAVAYEGVSVARTVTLTVLPQSAVPLDTPWIAAPYPGEQVGVAGVTFSWGMVSGAEGYDLRVLDGDGATVFTGSLLGGGSTSTLIGLPGGSYTFAVRACGASGFTDAACGGFGTTTFTVSLIAPAGAPTISAPSSGATLTSSTRVLSWTPVTPDPRLPTMTYEVALADLQRNETALQIDVPAPETSTVVSLRSSTSYELKVRACQAACGPFSAPVSFSVALAAVPATAPAVDAPAITGGNRIDVSWGAVAGADLYQVQVVQPAGGPGGGALTVAARQVSTTSVSLPVPAGDASVVVAACNGDGCGPLSAPVSITVPGPDPAEPNLGTAIAGSVVSGPTVLFTWNRVAGDDTTNTVYRLYVQDLSRQAAALDVYTRDNFYAAYLKAEGARYDALVVANPGCTGASATCSGAETAGPAAGFNVRGTSALAPTMVQPAHQAVTPLPAGNLAPGNVLLGWSPVPGATLYEYFVAVQGQGNATVTGVTPGLFVRVPLSAAGGADTVYSGIVRACPSGATCAAGSDAGWGPWSNQAGPGVTNFTVSPALRILSWGDQGDGSYRNPILKADFSDPDVIRVGDDFYLVGSDIHFMGIQVLHSKDLVNWTILGQVFSRLDVHERYDTMDGYGQGTWAPSIRYHAGKYRVYVCTPAEGLFMWEADDPAGPWSDTITVKAVQLWEDPSPFWDDDGNAYLVHSVVGAGPIVLHRMSADGRTLLDDGVEIYNGPVAEGPKLYKRNGYYYLSLPEGGVDDGWQTVLRSTSVYGPYESRIVLPAGSPHQGGLVELADGTSWFIGFKRAGFLGRISHLEPVVWGDDGWPVFGNGGTAVDTWVKPAAGRLPSKPRVSDEFSTARLDPVWQWNHNPVAGGWSLTERPGFLRLKASPASSLDLARDTLTQKIWDTAGTAEARLLTGGMADGQLAGLAFMTGRSFGWVGVKVEGGVRRIAWSGGTGPEAAGDEVRLQGRYDGDSARLLYSLDGGLSWTDTGSSFTLGYEYWKGARVGLFSYGPGGAADFDWFHYAYQDSPAAMPR